MQPLIVTLALDEAAEARFDSLRQQHFPPERNHLRAHVTLFHALRAEREQAVRRDLADVAARPPFPVRVAGLRSLGRGVAYALESPELDAVRAELARRWQPELTPQDRQPHRPHITVQNKASPDRARALLAALAQDFSPYDVTARGLALWRYLGGPWELLGASAFQGVDGSGGAADGG